MLETVQLITSQWRQGITGTIAIAHPVNSLAPGRFERNFIWANWSWFSWLGHLSLVKLPLDKRYWSIFTISKHWFRQWLGAVSQQAITWANVDQDLCRHMASLGHNELTDAYVRIDFVPFWWCSYVTNNLVKTCSDCSLLYIQPQDIIIIADALPSIKYCGLGPITLTLN